MPLSPIADEFLRTLLAHEDGMSDEQVLALCGGRYAQLEVRREAYNELIEANRVQLFKQGTSLVYRAIKEEAAMKLEGLG